MGKYKIAIFVLIAAISSYADTQAPDSLWNLEHRVKRLRIMIKSPTSHVHDSDAYINHYYTTDINNQVNSGVFTGSKLHFEYSDSIVETIWMPVSTGGITVPGEMVYNATNDRIYAISKGRTTPHISVLDGQSGQLLSVIHTIWDCRAIACSETSNKIYCINNSNRTIEVFDCQTQQVIKTIPLSSAVTDLIWCDVHNEIYYVYPYLDLIGVIDCVNDSLVIEIATGDKPDVLYYNSISDKIYCADDTILDIIDASNYSNINQIPIGVGNQSFSFNSIDNKIYCINEIYDYVNIIDGINDTLICTVPLGEFPCTAAYNTTENLIYIGHVHSGDVFVLDGNTNQVIDTLPFDAAVLSLAYDSLDNRLFVISQPYDDEDFFADMIVLDGTSHSVLDSLEAGASPWNTMIWEAEHNQIWVGNEGYSNLPGYTIDCFVADSLFRRFRAVVGFTPYASVLNPLTEKYYCVGRSDNFVSIFNVNNADSCCSKEVGESVWDILLNQSNNKIYCANNTGRDISVIDGASDSVITKVSINADVFALELNQTGNKIYAASALYPESSYIVVIDSYTDSVLKTISVPLFPLSILWNSIDNKLYVASCNFGGPITIIDAQTDTILTTIATANDPWSMIHNTIEDKIYCSQSGGDVIVIDGVTNQIITTITTGGVTPFTLAYNPLCNKIYCAQGGGITIIDGATDSIIDVLGISGFKYSLLHNPVSKTIFCAYVYPGFYPRPDGIIVIDGDTDEILANFPIENTQVWAWGWFGGICSPRKALLLDSLNNEVYLNHYFSSKISVFDGETGLLERSITPSLPGISFKVFPNPAIHAINIEMSLPHLLNSRMTIYDVSGRVVRSYELSGKEYHRFGWDGTDIHGDRLPSGVYFIQLSIENNVVTKKVLLIR